MEDSDITQKKTLKLKRSPEPDAGDEPQTQMTMPIPENLGAEKRESYVFAAICGILAVLCFAALMAVQGLELSYYSQPPTVWPF
jgi:hypothetical protein